MSTKKNSAASAAKEPAFTKDVLVTCKRFRDKCDLVSAILKDGAKYTISEVETMIAKYMKGKVK